MRIAMIGQKGLPARFGGVETHVHELSAGLVRRDIDVTAYARAWYTHNTPEMVDRIHIVYCPSVQTKHLDTATHTFFASIDASRKKFDVIHYHGVGPSLFAWIPRIFSPRSRIVTTFHTIDRKNTKWGCFARFCLLVGEWAACRFAHKTIAVSQTLQQYIRDVYDVQAAYIPNSVTVRPKHSSTTHIAQWQLEPHEYFLMVARLIPLKGAHDLITAYHALKQRHPDVLGNKKLVIVGDAVCTSDYVSQLHKQAANDPDIIFTGFQTGDALAALYSHAFALIHPSHYEGLSLTVLEGMSYALPVIVSDIPEHRLLIANSDRRFSCGDTDSLRIRLMQLLNCHATDRAAEGIAHQQRIQEQFNAEKSMTQISLLYAELLQSKPTSQRIPAI